MKPTHAACVAAVIAMLAAGALPAQAQVSQAPADQDHSAHHPDADQKTAPPAAAAPATPARPGMGMGGMGMMQGGQGQMPMMGNMGGQMMGGDMHRMMEMMHGRGMMMDGGVRHLEGRLAFLKTELQITSAQEDAWASFAGAMRKAAATKPATGREGQAATLPERLDSRLATLTARKAAIDRLYAQLDAKQKSLADDLIERIGLL
jgi:uncharacterized small protein (DUF1192 family)